MKKHGSKSIILAFMLVILLVLSSAGVSTQSINKLNSKSCSLSKSNTLGTSNIPIFSNSENILIAGSIYNESKPSMLLHGYNAVVAYEYKKDESSNIYFQTSTDGANNWSAPVSFNLNANGTSPRLVLNKYGSGAYGAFVTDFNQSSTIGEIEFGSLINTNKWLVDTVTWSEYNFSDFKDMDIVCYEDEAYPTIPYIMAFIGSIDVENDNSCIDAPMFCYRNPEKPGSYYIAWDPDVEHCSNISVDMDYSSNLIYGVCEIDNGTNKDLFFFNDNPIINGADWGGTTSISNQTFTGSESLLHPQILLDDKQIYIVAETDSNKIKLFNSSDKGETWNSKYITDDILSPGAVPKNPQVITNDTLIACSFIESGNLSVITSSNYGLNWSEPKIVNTQNGSAVNGYRFSNFIDMEHIVWTDNRNGKGNDLYCVVGKKPVVDLAIIPESVNLTYELDLSIGGRRLFTTKNLLIFSVINNGDAYVEDVFVNISYECENESSKQITYSPTIAYLGSGGQANLEIPLYRISIDEFFNSLINFAGIENITITIEIDNDENPGDNTYRFGKPDKDLYRTIFPRLADLEPIFKFLKPKN